jgi:carboxyl-terminal processing protease
MNKFFGRYKRMLIAVALIVLSFDSFGYGDNNFKVLKSLDIYFSLFKELNTYYVDETDPEKLVKTSIDAMLESLDPYTVYIPESEMDDFKFMTTGEYGGVGALIKKHGDYAMISDPYENLPAQKAGVMAGDLILEIDGKSIKGKQLDQVSSSLKGTPGTTVELLVSRDSTSAPLKFSIKREKITVPNVPYAAMVNDSTGYIRLTNFTVDASKEVRNAVTDLKSQHARSLILDLRGNPGGLLNEAISIVNVFVRKGQEVVSTHGKVKQWDKQYITTEEPIDTITPLVVLVNRGSASASEIVAGSLQDLDRAVIVGQRTFGKGLVQSTRPLSYNTQLKVTTAKYYIPSGRCIQALDYTHRNEDGSVGHVPDSLIRAFKTKNSRIVYDGGGIKPDITLEPETLSNIAYSLYAKDYMFDFAGNYVKTHSKPQKVSEIKITDPLYNDFKAYISNKDYDYKTKSEDQLDKLIEQSKKENLYDSAKVEFDSLKKKLTHDKGRDLEQNKAEISHMIEEEIASRYFYQKGRIQKSMENDNELDKAIELLRRPTDYGKILGYITETPIEVHAKAKKGTKK